MEYTTTLYTRGHKILDLPLIRDRSPEFLATLVWMSDHNRCVFDNEAVWAVGNIQGTGERGLQYSQGTPILPTRWRW